MERNNILPSWCSTGLSGNSLKLIAAACMLIDHAGFLLFPKLLLLRIIGRIAYPIYAFMIAEGCRYTKNRFRYFMGIFLLAVVCQTVYFVVVRDPGFSILITFSLSILLIYGWQLCKQCFAGTVLWKKTGAVAVFAGLLLGTYGLNQVATVDYGFWGSITPLLASLFMQRGNRTSRFDRREVHVTMLGIGLGILSLEYGFVQSWCLLALPLLYFYNGTRGKAGLKNFFYIFYPAHLVVLQGIYLLIS